MKIIFKLYEFVSSIFSTSKQLKDINIISITKGFELSINIFESISKNLSYSINYDGKLQFIKICLVKKKVSIGLGQIHILNQKRKQNIKIYPTYNNPIKKIINLIILCYNIEESSKKSLESYINPCKKTYKKHSNNYNSNSTSSLSISSFILAQNKNKTPINNYKCKKVEIGKINTSKTNIKNYNMGNINLFSGLMQNSVYSINNIFFDNNIENDNISIYSDNPKRKLSGSISNQSNRNYFSGKRNSLKKIISPAIYSYQFNKNKKREKAQNKKRNYKNKSMTNIQIKSNIGLIINSEIKNNYKNSSKINFDIMNKQIEDYIFDKSFENILQNDLPITSQEHKQFLYYDDLNSKKFDEMVKDTMELYKKENIKFIRNNDLQLEIFFLIEKIYEIMDEYYKEYHNVNNQNKSLINIIKYYGYLYNNLFKMKNKIKIKNNKRKIKRDLNNKNNQYYISSLNKIGYELNILNNINKISVNKKELKKKEFKKFISNIILKNKNMLNEEQNNKLKKIGMNIIHDRNIFDKKNNLKLSISNSNKKINNNKSRKNVFDNKRKKSVESTNSDLKENNSYRLSKNNIKEKLKVRTKIKNGI